MEIVQINAGHYPAIESIYAEGIATGNATFRASPPGWEEWDRDHLQHSRLGVMVDGELAGWAALTPVSSRCVYAGVAEVSVYVGDNWRGQGLGRLLLEALVGDSEAHGLWTLQSGIFPENTASIRVHEQCGFRSIGYREKIGKMNGVWRDNIIMERRSKVVGIE